MCTQDSGMVVRQRSAGAEPGHKVSRRAALAGAATVAASAALAGTAAAEESAPATRTWGRRGLGDLTYPFTTSFPVYAAGEESSRSTYVTFEQDGYYLQEWHIFEHTGTHVDAPGHFTPGGRLAPELRIEELVTPVVVIDISGRAAQDPDTVVTIDDVRAYERRYGRIPHHAAGLDVLPVSYTHLTLPTILLV